MFKTKSMSSNKAQITRKRNQFNKKLNRGVKWLLAFLIVTSLSTTQVLAYFNTVDKIELEALQEDHSMDVLQRTIVEEPSIPEYVFTEVEKELGFDNAVRAVGMIGGCENKQWDPEAKLINKGLTIDRGIWQINDYYHSEVSNACSYDYKCATKEAIRIIKERGFEEWTCGK